MITLASLLEQREDSESDEEWLQDVEADAARLRHLLDEDDEDMPAIPIEDAPTLKDLLQLCDADVADRLSGFICPECLMVATSQQALRAHYAEHATWKESAGRTTGDDDYQLGDATRFAALSLGRASKRTQRRLARRLRRLDDKPKWLVAGASTLGLAAALVGAPITGVAVAAGGLTYAVRRRTNPDVLKITQPSPGEAPPPVADGETPPKEDPPSSSSDEQGGRPPPEEEEEASDIVAV